MPLGLERLNPAAGYGKCPPRSGDAGRVAWGSRKICLERGLDTVALGGGCFQNARLLVGLCRRLEDAGLRVLSPQLLGPNDGAVSYGQAVVAAARMAATVTD